ncbi:MAG: NTP transferase domain-containing protein [Verrucomicrobia bacterium]|nr:NTP transferase domain-containing protein [Verrucomicrobiota bacterium]
MTSRNYPIRKAVLLAAGKGTRMKNLTSELPKPMLPVAGKPALEHILQGLLSAGIREFLIITGYRSQAVQSHFGDGSRWGASVAYMEQVVQDGTGRVVELAREFAGDDAFVLSYGDILVSPNNYPAIQELWSAKQPSDGILAITLGEDVRKGAICIFETDFRLCELIEKPSETEIQQLRRQFGEFKPWYNAGLYVFTPLIFDFTARLQKSARGEYELTDAIRRLARDGRVLRGLPINGYWLDVRDPEALAEANRRFAVEP